MNGLPREILEEQIGFEYLDLTVLSWPNIWNESDGFEQASIVWIGYEARHIRVSSEVKQSSDRCILIAVSFSPVADGFVRRRAPWNDSIRILCVSSVNFLTCRSGNAPSIVILRGGEMVGSAVFAVEVASMFQANRSVQDISVIGASKSFSTGTNITNARIWTNMSDNNTYWG